MVMVVTVKCRLEIMNPKKHLGYGNMLRLQSNVNKIKGKDNGQFEF